MPVPVVVYVKRHVLGSGALVCTLPEPPNVNESAVGYTATVIVSPVADAIAEVAEP